MGNEFEDLLEYLEIQAQKTKDLGLEKSKKKQSIIQPKSTNPIKNEKSQRVDKPKPPEISHFNEPKKEVIPQTSKGFDIPKFEKLMKQKLIEESKRIENYERPYISVSELCTCLRQGYYKRLKYPIDLEQQFNFPYLYIIQNSGTFIHDLIQEVYNFTETEKRIVSEKFKVKGRVDAIYDSSLIEIKTIDEFKFKNTYIKEHYHQALIYSYILNTEYNYKIDNISIVYVPRSFKKVHSFDLPIDMKLSETLISKSLLLLDAISKKVVVEPINSNDDICRWCLYKKFCSKDQSKIRKPYEKEATESLLGGRY